MGFESIGSNEKLPDKVVRIITESIMKGEWTPGDLMPTEPELAAQFGVSRSVIRDAVRMLIAKGLVVVKHGKGMYLSDSQQSAFADALVLALRREKASAWDTEEFRALVFPEIFALAAKNADEEEKKNIQEAAELYITRMLSAFQAEDGEKHSRLLKKSFQDFMYLIIKASKNKMFLLIGPVMLDLRSPRYVDGNKGPALPEQISSDMRALAKALTSGDSLIARSTYKKVFSHYKNMEDVLRNTPVEQKPRIKIDDKT